MAIQDSINNAIGTVATASAVKGLLTNQEAQMKATEQLTDKLESIGRIKMKIKEFGEFKKMESLPGNPSSVQFNETIIGGNK